MSSPRLSSAIDFVKKYPITLCGLSLFFMPTVHHLLLYFTPLLLSTAIFVVVMVSWGPGTSTSGMQRPRLLDEHHEWTFSESMVDGEGEGEGEEEEEREEGEEEETEEDSVEFAVAMADGAPALRNSNKDCPREEVSGREDAQPDVGLGRKSGEPDPDLSKAEAEPAGAVAAGYGDRPPPSTNSMGTAAGSGDCQARQAQAEPDMPDGSTRRNPDDSAELQHANRAGSEASSRRVGRPVYHSGDGLRDARDAIATAEAPHYLQVCA